MTSMDITEGGVIYILYKGALIGFTSFVFMYLILKINREYAEQRALFIGLASALYLLVFGPKVFGDINPTLQF